MTSSPIPPPTQSTVAPLQPATASEVKKTGAAVTPAPGVEEKKKKKEKKGLFANFRKKFKLGGGSGGKGEEVKSEGVRGGEGGKGTVAGSSAVADVPGPAAAEGGGEEEKEERERQELYKAIGYSEDEEYVEFPRNVS